jgi:hypothetical protein
MSMVIPAKHDLCSGTRIVVTRLFGEREYDGYCASCGGPVFGFLIEDSNLDESFLFQADHDGLNIGFKR